MAAMTQPRRTAAADGTFFRRIGRGTGTTPGVQALQKAVATMPARPAPPERPAEAPEGVPVPPAWRPRG